MKDKKHIDRLFQEKLKDLEVTPGDSVWNNISAELQNLNNESNKRKGIPVWWRIAGIAASLLLLLTLGQYLLNENNTSAPIENIVDTDFENKVLTDEVKENTGNENSNNKNNNIKENNVSKINTPNSSTLSNNSLSNTEQNRDQLHNQNSKNIFTNIDTYTKNKTTDRNTSNGKKTEVVASVITTKSEKSDLDNSNLPENTVQLSAVDKEKSNIALNEKNQSTEPTIEDEDGLNNITESEELNAIEEIDKLSLIDEVAINEDEDTDSDEAEFKKWSASSNIAPVYFNTLGNGSSIHPQFNNNS